MPSHTPLCRPDSSRRGRFLRDRWNYIEQGFPNEFAGVDHLVCFPWHQEPMADAEDVVLTAAEAITSQDFNSRRVGIAVVTRATATIEASELTRSVRSRYRDLPFSVLTQPHLNSGQDFEQKAWKVLTALCLAARLNTDFSTVDMDVRFISGWHSSSSLLRALITPFCFADPPAMVQLAVPRSFCTDDGPVHLLCRLLAAWRFGVQIRHMGGGDFSVSRDFVRRTLRDQSLMLDDIYDLEVELTMRALGLGEAIVQQPLHHKLHAPIRHSKVWDRFPHLIAQLLQGLTSYSPAGARVTDFLLTPNGDFPDYGPASLWAPSHCIHSLHAAYCRGLAGWATLHRQILSADVMHALDVLALARPAHAVCPPEILAAVAVAFANAWAADVLPRLDLAEAYRPIAFLTSLALLGHVLHLRPHAAYADLDAVMNDWSRRATLPVRRPAP